jgi:hypothetical protein
MSEFLAGCVSGCIQSVLGHPLDTIKVLAQTSNKKRGIRQPNNISVKTLYRGVSYPTAMNMLTSGVIFDTNSRLHESYKSHYKSGFITGLFTAPMMYFFDTGKIYHQTFVKNGNANTKQKIQLFPYKQFLKGNGLGATFGRECLATSAYMGVYFDLVERTSPLYAGGIAGLASWVVSYPIDVIKSRQMADCSLSFLDAARQGQLWRGFSVCALRAIIVNSAGFWAYDKVKHYY